jgi:hypothetical protein
LIEFSIKKNAEEIKEENFPKSYSRVKEIMETARGSILTLPTVNNKNMYIKISTTPNIEQKRIYKLLGLKNLKFNKKTVAFSPP